MFRVRQRGSFTSESALSERALVEIRFVGRKIGTALAPRFKRRKTLSAIDFILKSSKKKGRKIFYLHYTCTILYDSVAMKRPVAKFREEMREFLVRSIARFLSRIGKKNKIIYKKKKE